ncbi:acyltransferase [Paracholeplasma manati]|uniref:acyltransferase n=1 Tax=Paracholeplasma manati TaxID=591373 RepID=UPI002408805B|nr:acyltransferase [Paracholeplasma manati]MDG0888954.1 acyltransferase [Paracholeplasma manati]
MSFSRFIKNRLKKTVHSLGIMWLKIKHKNLYIDKSSIVEKNVRFYNDGIIKIGKNTIIRPWVIINPWGGKIIIGENCSINSFSHLSGNGDIEIGNNVLIATQCVLISANHNFNNIDIPIREQGETRAKIVIEDDCWLGAGVRILSGVKIGKGSVIGAGSVVNHSIPPYSVCVGVPARIIKNRNELSNHEK